MSNAKTKETEYSTSIIFQNQKFNLKDPVMDKRNTRERLKTLTMMESPIVELENGNILLVPSNATTEYYFAATLVVDE